MQIEPFGPEISHRAAKRRPGPSPYHRQTDLFNDVGRFIHQNIKHTQPGYGACWNELRPIGPNISNWGVGEKRKLLMADIHNRLLYGKHINIPPETFLKKMIMDLWPVLKRSLNGEVPRFTKKDSPHKIINWIVDTTDYIVGQSAWKIEFNEKHFFFSTLHEYHLEFDVYYQPIDCLPILWKVNRKIHNLMCDMMAYSVVQWGISSLEQERASIEHVLENEYDHDPEYIDFWEKLLVEYNTGIQGKYNKRLNKNVVLKNLEKRLRKIKHKNYLEKMIIDWVRDGISLAEPMYSIKSFFDYENLPAEYSEDPYPDQYILYGWSLGGDTYDLWESHMQWAYETGGRVAPMAYKQIASIENENSVSPPPPTWPYDLADWLARYLKIHDRIHKKYGGK